MEERMKFVLAAKAGEDSLAGLCRRFGVSRETGYKWLRRYAEGGVAAMREGSHAPKLRPHGMADAVREAVLALKRERPAWGPKKLKAHLGGVGIERLAGLGRVPAASTLGALLKREGLSKERRRAAAGPAPHSEPLAHAHLPNDVWSIDFKGHFRTRDGNRCDPLTVTDNASRYLIRLTAMPAIDQDRVAAVVDAAFREHGLPLAIRSDNGTPFATGAPGGLSSLSVRWLRLGIRHERIEPGEPQQNGRHERFHRSLVAECLEGKGGVAWDWRVQQRVFADYAAVFNRERPHEALEMKTPAEAHAVSPRKYAGRIPPMEYPAAFHTRVVNAGGRFLWAGRRVPLTKVLAGEPVGLLEADNDIFEVHFGPALLGWLDGKTATFVRRELAEKWARKSEAGGTGKKGAPPAA